MLPLLLIMLRHWTSALDIHAHIDKSYRTRIEPALLSSAEKLKQSTLRQPFGHRFTPKTGTTRNIQRDNVTLLLLARKSFVPFLGCSSNHPGSFCRFVSYFFSLFQLLSIFMHEFFICMLIIVSFLIYFYICTFQEFANCLYFFGVY